MKLKILYKLISIIIISVVIIPVVFKNYGASASLNSSVDKKFENVTSSEDYLVKVKYEDDKETIKENFDVVEEVAAHDEKKDELDKWVKVKINDKDDLNKLNNDKNVEVVVKDQKRKLSATPNDPYYSSTGQTPNGQWNLRNICLSPYGSSSPCNSAWENASETGGLTVVIAVIDSGIDLNHPDLSGNVWTNPTETLANGIDNDSNGYVDDIHGWNFADNNNNVQDTFGHGTHVAGIASAAGDNGVGISGVCWSCKIMPLKVINSSGYAYDSDIAAAIRYATDNGARIINMSLGGPGYSQVLQDAVDYAWSGGNTSNPDPSKSVLVVSSSGNDGDDASNSYPGGLMDSLSIGSLTYSDNVAGYSNKGKKVDVAAPGDNVISTYPDNISTMNYSDCLGVTNNHYCFLSGTSMASPHVAGLAALLFHKHSTWTAMDVRNAIIKGVKTTDLSGNPITPGFDNNGKGYGIINALNTLNASQQTSDVTLPTASLTAPAGNTVNNTWNITGTASDANLYLYMINLTQVSNGNVVQLAGRSNVTSGTLFSFNTTTVPNDYYNVSMTVEDFYGNKKVSNTLTNVVIDNAAPGTFSVTSPINTAWVNSLRPTVTWNAASSVSAVKYSVSIDGNTVVSNLSSTSYTLTSSISNNQTHTVSVVATNVSGLSTNSSNTVSFKTDITLPQDFSIGLSQPGNSATFTFSTIDYESGILRLDLLFNGVSYANASSPLTISNISDGNYIVQVYAHDIAGNTRIVSKSFSVAYRTSFLKTKGDFNGNGVVDLSDLSILAQNYGKSITSGDINGDGKVDLSDLSILAQNWQKSF